MGRADHLRRRYAGILADLGLILLLCSAVVLTPLLALIGRPEELGQARAFLVPAACLAAFGALLFFLRRSRGDVVLSVQEGGVIVVLSWGLVCLASAWPLMSAAHLGFTQAVFESVSGWTTTGLSVVDVEHTSHVVLLWRAVMQLAGGAGLAIIMLAALTGPTGPALSVAEGRDQLVPNVRQSAKLVLRIYASYAVVGVVGLRAVGMGWFDAVLHAFAAISTGGFGSKAQSIGYWDSPAIEIVTMFLMVLGNLNFVVAWLLFRGRVAAFSRNGEIRLQALLLPVAALLLFSWTCTELYATASKAARVAIFETVSALTTTGFSTVSYGRWNGFGWLILIVLMLVGGGTCSTAGGLKQFRVHLLAKNVLWQVRRSLLPSSAVLDTHVWGGEAPAYVDDRLLVQTGTFVFLYLATVFVSACVIAGYGFGLGESLFEAASAVGTVGLSVGVTSPSAPAGVLWTETAGMFLGRLELFVVFASVAKLTRDLWTLTAGREQRRLASPHAQE